MRIAIFSWEYPPFIFGGLGVYTVNMAKTFVEMGNEVSIFSLNYDSREIEEQGKLTIYRPSFLDTSSIFPLIASEELRGWGPHIKFFTDVLNYGFLSALKFIQLAKKFDVVAIHDWLSAFAGLILKEELRVPLAFHLHSIEEVRSPDGSETVKRIEKEMGKKADQIIAVSNSMKDFLISVGYEEEKISVCYNGCDPKVYDPKKVDTELVDELRKKYKVTGEVMFFIGRLVWFKGIYNLVQAMPLLLRKHPKAKLVMVGQGWDYPKLMSMIKKLGLQRKVMVINKWLSEKEKVAHYALADICVFPSINEPFGIVALEAMAMEKPVVVGAAGVSGFREQVIPAGKRRTGVHVNGNDPKDIAWGIEEALTSDAKRWGKNGRKRVVKEFTWHIAAKKTLALYERL